jgi:probable HAF family extracellular repeat protein
VCILCGAAVADADSFTFTIFHVPDGFGQTTATGINSQGQVVGYFHQGGITHGFLRSSDGSSYTILDVPGATNTLAWGINDNGLIVGFYADNNHGFL